MATPEEIIALYVRADERLRALVQSLEDGNVGRRRKELLLRQIEAVIADLTDQAGQQTALLIGDEYRAGAGVAVQQIMAAGVAQETVDPTLKPVVHQRAAQAIMDEAFYSILQASQHMSEDAKDRIEKAVKVANEKSLLSGISRHEATRQAIADLNNKGITGVVARNGAQIPVTAYMKGVVHYHQRKAHVTGTENMAVQNGYDLVYVNYVGITCEHCARKQGRVYSLSGNDKRWPHMTEEFKPPYHSHCVHSMSIWIEEYQSPVEVERLRDVSSRLGEETRSEQHIRRYKELQREKAQLNEDRKQWARYRAVAPDETPKSFAAFRRMKYNDSEGWFRLQGDYRKLNAYSKTVANEPKITADLQAISKATDVEMVGLEYRIKSKESYLRKVASDAKGTDLQAISDAISGTNDVIRYTYQSSPDKLVNAYKDVHQELLAKGYEQFKLKNTWLIRSNPYKGINSNYRSPDGQRFEVQFHTPESFALKNGELHALYEKWRVMPNKADPEAVKLSKQMSEMSSKLQVPDRIEEVK